MAMKDDIASAYHKGTKDKVQAVWEEVTKAVNCRLQRISPFEEKVVQLTGLVTSTSGISGTMDFGVGSEFQEDTRPSEMDISAHSEDPADAASFSKRRQQHIPKESTLSLQKEQINSQKEFYEEVKKFNDSMEKKYDEMSTYLRRINRSMVKMSDVAAKQLEEERRHNKIKGELLKKKMEIKLRMLNLEHPSFDSD